ncbi:unnamed protein product [Ambrosiozyma monospora]|uniref:Unnamed protein product n=1 Tax=Ambrosiozyma monospora TaxID=43982 RepID=A0ACB5TKY8_AMBMO|nr:unnamed protein product [Ambrosiozyma monospora]
MPIMPNSVVFEVESKRQKLKIMELLEQLLDMKLLNEEVSQLDQEKILSALHPKWKINIKLDKLPKLPRQFNETNFNEYIINLVNYNYRFGSKTIVQLLDEACNPVSVRMLTRETLLEISAFYYRCNYFSRPFTLRSLILQERPDINYDSEFYALELDYIRDCDVSDVIVFILESLIAQRLTVSWCLIYKIFYLLDLDGRKMLVDLLSRKKFEFNGVFEEFLLVKKKFETSKHLQSYLKKEKLGKTRGLTQIVVEKFLEEGLLSKAWFFIKKQANEHEVRSNI